MMAKSLRRAFALFVLGFAIGLPRPQAKDRAFDHDWRTGVTVAPGAMTWTADNYEQKKALIKDTAAAREARPAATMPSWHGRRGRAARSC